MSNTAFINDRLDTMDMTAEARTRALQAAFAGEILGSVLTGIGRGISRLFRGWQKWSEARRSMTSLKRLDNRLLADIGLSHATLEDSLFRRNRDFGKSSVEVEISDMMPARIAANQDHRDQRTAA